MKIHALSTDKQTISYEASALFLMKRELPCKLCVHCMFGRLLLFVKNWKNQGRKCKSKDA